MVKLSSVFARSLVSFVALSVQSQVIAYDSLYHPQYNNEAAGYARAIELKYSDEANGKLLATWEHWYLPKGKSTGTNGTASHYIIRESSNHGTTWDTIANVTAPDNDYTSYWQPFLFEFPQTLGKYPAGTLLLVGNLVKGNDNHFHSWRSPDHGQTWSHVSKWQTSVSTIPNPDKPGETIRTGIWEPFLFLNSQNQIVAVFSDERDYKKHSQKLVVVTSGDGGDTWSNKTQDVVAGDLVSARPGMATVAQMDNDEYFMVYEWCDTRTYGSDHAYCSIHGKTSKDGINWNPTDNGTFVSTPDGVQASGSPYVIWDPVGKQLVVASRAQRQFSENAGIDDPNDPATAMSQRIVHINKNYGLPGNWSWASAPWFIPNSPPNPLACNANYSPNLLALSNGTVLYTTNQQSPGAQCEEDTGAVAIASLPYTSNFSSIGNASWIEFDSHWSVSGDQYNFGPVTTPATISLTGSSGWTDYEISAEVTIKGPSGVAGVLVRASNSFTAPNNLTRYSAVIDTNRGDLAIYLVSEHATSTKKTKAISGGVKTDQKYHLSLSVKSTALVANLTDGKGTSTTLDVEDNGLLRGAAGLYGSSGSGYFSNVQIKSLA